MPAPHPHRTAHATPARCAHETAPPAPHVPDRAAAAHDADPPKPYEPFSPVDTAAPATTPAQDPHPVNPEPAAPPVQTPKSAFSRINPLNPEPAPLPAQNPEFAFPQINPMNPEPAAPPAQNSVSAFSRINPMDPKPIAALAQNPKIRVFPNRPSDPPLVQNALRHLRDGDIRPGPHLHPIAPAAGVFVLAATQHPSHDCAMADAQPDRAAALARQLLGLTARFGARADEDPFGNPVLSVALAITRRIDTGELSEAAIGGLIRYLRDAAFADRARRLAAYVGGVDTAENDGALARLAQTLLRPDPNDSPVRWAEYRALVERTRFAAVFTAHPTFALPVAVGQALADAACGRSAPAFDCHRPPPVTLQDEFAQSAAAIENGRDALDRLNAALLSVARSAWPDRWTELAPRPVVLSSWVGYDTDGRTDIGWWDTLRLRLEMKRLQLLRLHAQMAALPSVAPLAARVADAREAVEAQIAAWPRRTRSAARRRLRAGDGASAGRCVGDAGAAAGAVPRGDRGGGRSRRGWRCASRAPGWSSHGLSLAHTHVRLNSAQLHNVVRQRLGIADPPEDPAHRRALLARDQRGARCGAAGAGGFRRAAGRAGLGRQADDDGRADRQARRRRRRRSVS